MENNTKMLDPAAELVREQLAHFQTTISANLNQQASDLKHHTSIDDAKHAAIEKELNELRSLTNDYEQRIRNLTETATQYRLFASLATGGGLLSIISLIRAFFP